MSTFAIAFCLFAVALHLASAGLAGWRCARWRRPAPRHDAPDIPAISVLRPVCGLDPAVVATLPTTFRLAGIPHEVIFAAASPTDAAVPLVRRLIAEHPGADARLLVGEEQISRNPKLNNLAKAWRAAQHPWVAIIDDNVVLGPDSLERLRAAWRPDTGLVCSPPIGVDPRSAAAELECAFLNTFQGRWQYAADAAGLGFAQGKVMFFRRDIIDDAGGLERLGQEPAEDAAATKVVRAAGLRVRLTDPPFQQPLGSRTFATVWRRQVRWARLRRATFPLFFAPEILTGALLPALALAYWAAGAGLPVVPLLALFLAGWYAVEAILSAAAGWHLGWRTPIAWIGRDLLLPALWVEAWIGDDFVWRGNPMTVGREAG